MPQCIVLYLPKYKFSSAAPLLSRPPSRPFSANTLQDLLRGSRSILSFTFFSWQIKGLLTFECHRASQISLIIYYLLFFLYITFVRSQLFPLSSSRHHLYFLLPILLFFLFLLRWSPSVSLRRPTRATFSVGATARCCDELVFLISLSQEWIISFATTEKLITRALGITRYYPNPAVLNG